MDCAQPPQNQLRVAVVVVSYASSAEIAALLASLPSEVPFELEVIVADNKPDEDAVAAIAETFGAHYLACPDNPGYGTAVNRAVRALPTAPDWILVCNPDLVLQKQCLERLVAAAREEPRLGAIGPLIREGDGSIFPSARKIPSLRTGIGHALFAGLWPTNPWSTSYRNETRSDGRRDTGWLSGACLLIAYDVFQQLAGFDEHYFMYFEDVDLGYRIQQLGLRSVYEPAAEAIHTGGHSTQHNSTAMLTAHHRSATRFLTRKYSRAWHWPLRGILRIGLMLRLQVAIRSKRGKGSA